MGARGRARDCAGTSRSLSGKNDDASSDSRTSLRHHQVLDGSNALSHETAAEGGNRDGAQCARLQHETRDGDNRRGRSAGGLSSLSQGLAHSNGRQQTLKGSLRALREWILEETEFSHANAGGVLRALPIQGLFHTAWARRVGSLRHQWSGFWVRSDLSPT